ncbi:hypothetical protein ES708_25645 [subsurface metagenome]
MLEWKQSAEQRRRNKCPRCLTILKRGQCPRCGWPGFKLMKGWTQKEWDQFEKGETERRKRQKIKRQAKSALRKTIKEGKFVKPNRCENCGELKKLEAHHWSYLPQNWIDVIWLCVECHRKFQDYTENIMTNTIKPNIPLQ